jgi:hypothetical protein
LSPTLNILILLAVVAAMSFAFARAAIYLLQYRRALVDVESGMGRAMVQKHPRLLSLLRMSLPVVVAGFFFNAAALALAFIYVAVRFANDFL